MNIQITDYKSTLPIFNHKDKTAFQGAGTVRFLDGFIRSQENLSATRFIQNTATNWVPKTVLARSKADFWEFTLLEFIEAGLFYFAAPFFGESIFRNKLFKHAQPKNLRENFDKNITKSVEAIKKSALETGMKNRLISGKAGIVTACLAVPALEYSLSFAKNLFTLKVFKVSDFNNIANLNKEKTEDLKQQELVETHSKKELLKAGLISAAGITAGLAISKGHNSRLIQKLSEIILEPGRKFSSLLHKAGIKSKRADRFLKEYATLDFGEKNGKFTLSKGQLAVICTTGLFGYSNAAKDRGKLDLYEVWTRVPLVVLYTIFGSEGLESGFKKHLLKKGMFPELIKKDENGFINVPSRDEIPSIAKKLAEKNKTEYKAEWEKLIRQKAIITGVPYLFSLIIMGFTLTAITRLWTQYRYNRMKKKIPQSQTGE